MYKQFVDRIDELKFLNDEYNKKSSSLVIVYGRRRNGKTTLLSKYLENKKGIYFLFTEEKEEINRYNFSQVVLDRYPSKYPIKFNNWEDIFRYIIDNDKKPVIVLDEFQYLGMQNEAFPSVFQKIWDNILKKTNSKVIVCGSLINMMYNQTLNLSSPLYGRRTGQIKLQQISYNYYNEFFTKKNEKELMEFYAVSGGVPRYIEELKDENNLYNAIEKHILNKNSYLYAESEFLLKKEVKDIGNYFSLMKVIAEGSRKISEMSAKLNIKQTSLTFYLNVLKDLDIIQREVPITEKKKEKSKKGLYKIKDNFINFWFRFVYPYKNYLEIGNTDYVMSIIKENFIPKHMSYVYEDICREKINNEYKVMRVGKWWDAHNEIDIVGVDEDKKYVVFAECKYSKKKINTQVLDELIEKSNNIKEYESYNKEYALFSISGYDDSFKKIDKNVKLRLM